MVSTCSGKKRSGLSLALNSMPELFSFQIKALDTKLAWKLSGILVSHLQVGDEFYIRQILKQVVFNPDYLDPTDAVIWKLGNAEIAEGLKPSFWGQWLSSRLIIKGGGFKCRRLCLFSFCPPLSVLNSGHSQRCNTTDSPLP